MQDRNLIDLDTSDVTIDEDGNVYERLEGLQGIQGLAYFATCPAGMAASTTTLLLSSLLGLGEDFFNTDWAALILHNVNSDGNAPEGEVRDITNYVSATGTFTATAFSANVEAGDKVLIIRREVLTIDSIALKTTPITNSLAYRLSQFLASGDGDWATGQPLPSNTSLVDIAGDFTGPHDGAAQDDNVKASLDLAHIDLDAILTAVGGGSGVSGTSDSGTAGTLVDTVLTQANDYWNGNILVMTSGNNVGLARTIVDFDAASDTLVVEPDFPNAIATDTYIILSRDNWAAILIGNNNANNEADTSAVVGNADGSVLERLELTQTNIATIDGFHDVPVADAVTNAQIRDALGNKTDTVAGTSVIALAKQIIAAAVIIDAFHDVPGVDAATNAQVRDVVGNKTDTIAGDSLVALIKQIVADTITISGGTLPADPTANSLAAYLASGGTALGQELPDSQSIVDIVGDFTGPHDGAAQDDNIKASLDLAHTDVDIILANTPRTVERSAALVPQTAQAALFTVSGGRIKVLDICGEVTVEIGNVTTNTKLIANPTLGADVDICATADIDSDVVGTMYNITGTFANAMVATTSGAHVAQAASVIIAAGTIDLDCAASTVTGQVKWLIRYEPIDIGATVTVA